MQVPTEIMVAMITSGCAMVASIISAWLNYEQSVRQRDKEAKRDKIEEERGYIYDALLKGVAASLQSNDISLVALQHGHLNGNVEEARKIVKDAQGDLVDAQRKAVSHVITT